MRAVRRAESVVDVKITQGSKPAGKPIVVLIFLSVEAQVLEQHDLAIGQRVYL